MKPETTLSASTPHTLLEKDPELLQLLPPKAYQALEPYWNDMEEIVFRAGYDVVVNTRTKSFSLDVHTSSADIQKMDQRLPHRFKSNGRTGFNKTLHRIAKIPDIDGNVAGMHIRFARYIEGLSEPNRRYVEGYPLYENSDRLYQPNILIVGAPGRGKTTYLRDLVRIAAAHYGAKLVVIDSANELGGYGPIAHHALGIAIRLEVMTVDDQPRIINNALINYGPRVMVVDELSTADDVKEVVRVRTRGVRVIASVHGHDIVDVLENPMYAPILGTVPEKLIRRTSPLFDIAFVMLERGQPQILDIANATDRYYAKRRNELEAKLSNPSGKTPNSKPTPSTKVAL
jgi:stage III sporulation protein SpoIIIAA